VFFFQAEDGIRDRNVTGVQTCALPIYVEEIKPSPELYLTAVQRLNYNPVNCLAIEDSDNGATAAVNAGLDVIVNTNDMTEKQDRSEERRVGKECRRRGWPYQ